MITHGLAHAATHTECFEGRKMADDALEQALLREYRATVDNLLQTGDSGIVANSSPRHATIILEEMIKNSHVSFIASAEGMSEEVWTDNVLRLLSEAKSRSVSVKLLVKNECIPLSGGRMPENLKDCVRRVSGEYGDGEFLNLAVSDRKAFRLEMDEQTKRAAFCANNPRQAAAMSAWFNSEFAAGSAQNSVA